MKYFRILAALLLLPVVAFAQPQSHLSGQVVSIDATRAVNICSGTEDIRLATGCTGGGTQYTWVFDASTGKLTSPTGFKFEKVGIDAGSSSEPSLFFNDETDLGIYKRAAGQLAFTNGVTQITFRDSAAFRPEQTNTIDLGDSGSSWKDIWLNGGVRSTSGSNLEFYTTSAFFDFYYDGSRVFRIKNTTLEPETDGGVSLGTSGNSFDDAWLDGQLLMSNGTAALPAHSFSSDPDTGYYREASGQIAVSSNASKRWAFQTDGDFELATTSAGLVLRSPDGTYSKCTVDNADAWSCAGV